jgi:alkylation response protein AidB-like acyl-CoA dehydrogenase
MKGIGMQTQDIDTTTAAVEPFSLSPLHAEIEAQAGQVGAAFAGRSLEVRTHLLDRSEQHPQLWQAICEHGWPGLCVPTEHGGTEGGLLGYVLVMEALAAAGVPLWMPVLTAAIGHSIAVAGPDTARERWLEGIATGEVLLGLAATEPECGHNLFRVQTTIERRNGAFVVNGVKAVTSGTDLADRVMVFGRAPREAEGGPARFTTVLVDPDSPGLTRHELPMRGREGVRQFRLEFSDVEVPADGLVGAEGEGLLVLWPFTHVERLLTAGLCLGGARYCFEQALGRAKERTIFGERPIGAEQAVSHPLAWLHVRHQAARLLLVRAAARFDAGADSFAVAGEANMAKLMTAELFYDAADQAMQTLGASAWDERAGMMDVFLDARLGRSGPVSQELALNFVAQHVLGLPSHR